MKYMLVVALLLAQARAQNILPLGKMLDVSNSATTNYVDGKRYGYAPAGLFEDGVYHVFYCSDGEYGPGAAVTNNTVTQGKSLSWDFVRYATSRNGNDWSPAKIILRPNQTATSTSVNEQAACDPSVVKAPDGYYYLFYGGVTDGPNGVIFVARSLNIAGPYSKLRLNDTWAVDAPDPKSLIGHVNPNLRNANCPSSLQTAGRCQAGDFVNYGIGMPSVVYHAGEFHMWYLDATHPDVNQLTFYTHATNAAGPWATPQAIDKTIIRPGDVKRNPSTSQWEFFYLENESKSSYVPGGLRPVMRKMTSTNGVNWTIQAFNVPVENDANNPGILSKRAGGGTLDSQNDGYLIIYGGPVDAVDNDTSYGHLGNGTAGSNWGNWDLLAKVVNPSNIAVRTLSSSWQWGGMGLHNRVLSGGDYDGDGLTDRAIINVNTGAWYVIPTKAETAGMTGIPWGSTLGIPYTSGMQPLVGDYDGDGKTDPGMVDVANGRWYIRSSKNGYTQGMPAFRWGAQWAGMGSQHKVVQGGDYDGDGKTDFVIVNISNGRWYVIGSAAGTAGIPGIPWDTQIIPGSQSTWEIVVGDFDGDGKTDPAMVDPSLGKWYVISSKDGYTQGLTSLGYLPWGWAWGGSNHQVAPADYDGDGKTDPAMYEKTTGRWWIIASRRAGGQDPIIWDHQSFATFSSQWDLVKGDFDGGGQADRVFVDRATGTWHFRGSRNPFGSSTQILTFDLP